MILALDFYIMDDSLPSWTDVVQASAAIIGTIAAIIGAWKLIARDKQRESEIKSLASIASKINDLQLLYEKRFVESKKPHIQLEFKRDLKNFVVCKNTNPLSQIVDYSRTDLRHSKFYGSVSPISNEGTIQKFNFSVSKVTPGNPVEVEVIYSIQGGFKFKQLIHITDDGWSIKIRGDEIILVE